MGGIWKERADHAFIEIRTSKPARVTVTPSTVQTALVEDKDTRELKREVAVATLSVKAASAIDVSEPVIIDLKRAAWMVGFDQARDAVGLSLVVDRDCYLIVRYHAWCDSWPTANDDTLPIKEMKERP